LQTVRQLGNEGRDTECQTGGESQPSTVVEDVSSSTESFVIYFQFEIPESYDQSVITLITCLG